MKLALAADRIFTALSDSIEHGTVIVEDGTIRAVAPQAPPGVEVLRLPGATLVPGLIDAHTHLSIVPSRGDQITQMRAPLDQQLAASRSNVLADLMSGVTTMRIMGQELGVDFRLRDEIAAGTTLGPDLACAGVQLAKQGGHGHALTAVADRREIVELVSRNAGNGARLIKIFVTGGVSSVATSQGDCPFSEREIRWAADAAHAHGLPLAAHAHGGEGARRGIENGVDTIEHGVLLEDRLLDEVARRDLAIVGTFSIQDHPAGIQAGDAGRPDVVGKLREARERVGATWRRILRSRIRIAVGTDSMHGRIAFDIARLIEFGASPARALRAATRDGAAVCGFTDRGAIAPGLRADVVAVAGNPLEDITAIACPLLVMKAGAIVHRFGV